MEENEGLKSSWCIQKYKVQQNFIPVGEEWWRKVEVGGVRSRREISLFLLLCGYRTCWEEVYVLVLRQKAEGRLYLDQTEIQLEDSCLSLETVNMEKLLCHGTPVIAEMWLWVVCCWWRYSYLQDWRPDLHPEIFWTSFGLVLFSLYFRVS